MNDFSGPPPSGSGTNRPFPRIKEFISVYAYGVGDDQRSAQTYCDCESDEAIDTLRKELSAVSGGNFNSDIFDLLVGKNRVAKHGSYENWAKVCLLWIAQYNKKS
jgi:hypothetical protein